MCPFLTSCLVHEKKKKKNEKAKASKILNNEFLCFLQLNINKCHLVNSHSSVWIFCEVHKLWVDSKFVGLSFFMFRLVAEKM